MSDQPTGVDEQKVIDEDRPAGADKTPSEQQKAISDFNKTSTKAGMRVHVHSPFQDYFDGMAFSLSAVNATGPFDILPKHHNFISLLLPCEIMIHTIDEGERRIRISGGIIHVKANQVIVFLDV